MVVPFGVAQLGADHDAGAEDQYRDEDCTHSAQDQSGDPVRSVQLPPPGPLALRDWSTRRVGVYKSLRGFSRASLRSGVMTELKRSNFVGFGRQMLSKVPEVTVWFWVIKVLCTTVGESFADWINMTLGVGLIPTSLIFTVVLVAVLAWQLALTRYVPFVYWLTVVVVSVTGTLYTDILTDTLGVPLVLSTTVFAAVLAVVFGVWYARERTLSIHSITTTPRELFYWLAILVTFALGTAAGDWTLELTGWGPGISVLLPAGLIVAIFFGWKLGANAVLSFWLAYILTRPLGANLGDWLGFPMDQQGLGLGVAITSVIFLTAILVTVVYLTVTRADVIETPDDIDAPETRRRRAPAPVDNTRREMVMLRYYAVVAVAADGCSSGRPRSRTPRRPPVRTVGLVRQCDVGSWTVGDRQLPAGGGREAPRRRPRRQGLAYLSCPQRASALLNGR